MFFTSKYTRELLDERVFDVAGVMDIRVDDAVTGRPKQIGVVHRNVAAELIFDEGAESLEVAKRLIIGDSTGELVLRNAREACRRCAGCRRSNWRL